MNNRGGSRADLKHEVFVRTSADLSVLGDESTGGLSVAVSGTPDPTDSTAAGSSLLTLLNPMTPDDRSLQRPNSVHSRTPSITKHHDQSDTQLRANVTSPETDMREAADLSVQAEVPYEGPSTPSHPYQMYRQRAMSTSTQSIPTIGPDGLYLSSREPTHPYHLYPQSTPASGAAQPGEIPVGFPGLGNTYPGIAGAGGGDVRSVVASPVHSEELPPYTRYPNNDLAEKVVDAPSTTEEPSTREDRRGATLTATPPPSIPAIPGAGGIGLATRDPEFASTSSEPASPRLSTRSFTSDDSHHEINASASTVVSEKLARSPWRQRATRKLWGTIPCWVIGLLGIVLILMGTILGAVIGTFMSKQEKTSKAIKKYRPPFGEFNATQDVVLLNSVPRDLPDLDIGEWGLLPLVVNQAPSTCLKTPSQSPAWTCNTPFNIYWVDIRETDTAPPTSAYQLRLTTSKNSTAFTKYAWGARPPVIPNHEGLRLVRDPFEPGLGPAWWVRVAYNKTVVLPEDRLSRSTAGVNNHARRSLAQDRVSASGEPEVPDRGDHIQDTGSDNDAESTETSALAKPAPAPAFPFPGAKEGDRPWICTWPDTVLEFFIYPGQNNMFSIHAATASFTSSPGVPTPTKPQTFLGKPLTDGTTPTWPPGSPVETKSVNSTGGKSDTSWAMPKFPSRPPPFPKIMRISERRVDGLTDANASGPAFCEQVEIIDGGKNHRPVLDEKGRAVQVALREQTRMFRSFSDDDDGADTGEVLNRDKPRGECGCVWMIE